MEQPHSPEPDRKNVSWLAVVVVLLILAGVALTAYYSVRVLRAYAEIRHTPLRVGVTNPDLVRNWMTIPYIARSYRIPEEYLWQGLGIPAQGNRFKSLRALNRETTSEKPGNLLSRVMAIIGQYESEHPSVTPAVPHELQKSPVVPAP
jgi:hypothetical protein